MVKVTVEISDLEYDVMRLYNNGETLRTIQKALGINKYVYGKAFNRLRMMGLVVPRGRRPKKAKGARFRNPRYWTYNTGNGYYSVVKGTTYYCCMKTRRGAEQMVELLKECDWDKSRVKELKAKVIE